MEFLQVGELLTRIAELVLPPLFGIAAVLAIVHLVNRPAFHWMAAKLKKAVTYHHRVASARERLETYGLGWLVPFGLTLVFVISVLVVHGVLAMAGGKLPPVVSRDDIRLVPPMIDRDDRLLLLRRYPGVEDFTEAYDLAIKAWDLSGKKTFDDTVEYYWRGMRMAKYLALVALGAWVIGLGRPERRWGNLLRLLAIGAGCVLFWALCLHGYLGEVRGSYIERWHEIRNQLRVDAYSHPVPPPSAEERRKMQDRDPKPWWQVGLSED